MTQNFSSDIPMPHIGDGRFLFLQKRAFRFLLLLLGGALMALTLIFTELFLLQWVLLLPAAMVILILPENGRIRLRGMYGYGLLFFWGYYAVVFHWFFSMYPLSYTGLSPLAALGVVVIATFGLSFLQALFSGFAFVAYGLAARSPLAKRYPVFRPFLFAAAWTIFEWIQTFGWWGVPWGRLPIGQIEASPIVQPIRLFGSYWITFLLVAVNGCIAYAILNKRTRRLLALISAALFVSNLLLGTVLLFTHKEEGKSVKVAAIQGNTLDKWENDSYKSVKEIYRRLSLKAAEEGAEIILWPETALTYFLTSNGAHQRDFVSEVAKETGAVLLVGAFRMDQKNGEIQDYNAVFAVSPDGTISETAYDKQHLVPFGEFVPMRDFVTFIFPPLASIGMLASDLAQGEEATVLETVNGNLGCMICFDSIYESSALDAVKNGAELLCLSSNDAWFLDSAAIYMHHNQARIRALETGRYLLRSGNSGITSVISPTGEVLTEIEPLIEGYVVSEVKLLNAQTLYSVIGNLFVYLLIAFEAGVASTYVISLGIRRHTEKRRRA